jgi:non-specific serine/threonine protein kinase
VVEASYELCTPAEQRVWAAASVFAGGFDVEAAAEVCRPLSGADGDHRTSLDGLVDKSVLTVSQEGQNRRYRMLETIRRFGAEQLDASGAVDEVRRRHRDHYLGVARRAEADWSGPRQPERLALLRRERANLRAALDFCFDDPAEGASGVAFVGLLWPLWIVGAFLKEGSQWVDRVRDSRAGSDTDRLRVASVGVLIACLAGDVPRARAIQGEVETLASRVTDPVLSAIAARALGTVEMVDGRLDAALPHLERSVDLLAVGTPHSLALVSHADLGVVLGLTGDHDKAEVRCEEGRDRCVAVGETWALSWILFVLNFVRLVRDEHDDATGDLKQMLRIKRDFDDVLGVLHATELLAWVAARRDPRRAAVLLGANEALWRPFGQYLLSFRPYLARHDRCVAQTREQLGAERYEECRRAGAAMDLPRLAAYALDEHADVDPAGNGPGGEPGDEPGVEPGHELRGRRGDEGGKDGNAPADHGLTAREQEVCGLVAQGLTDRQIAEQLVISPRTVQTHVTNILGKLGFRSRTEVARWARTQGLADSS